MTSVRVAGIDGCKGGWVCIRRQDDAWTWATADVEGIGALIDNHAVTGIDIPIGLLDAGERECDRLARQALLGAASRVFSTPPRPVLELGWPAPNDAAQDLSRRLTGKGISRQALALGPRVLAVDAVVDARPQATVIEVHPELSFAAMADGRPLPSKKSPEGVALRIAALSAHYPDAEQVIADAPPRVAIDDVLDAFAVLWTAERWRDGSALTLPPRTRTRPFIAT